LGIGLAPYGASASKKIAINSRVETIQSSTAARRVWAEPANNRKRCVVPINGFFEWPKPGQPYYITAKSTPVSTNNAENESLLYLAGLYSNDNNRFTILTMSSEHNAVISRLHSRQPVFLSHADIEMWLDHSLSTGYALGTVLREVREAEGGGRGLVCYRVPSKVGDVRFEDPECVVPVEDGKGSIHRFFGNAGKRKRSVYDDDGGGSGGEGAKEIEREEKEENIVKTEYLTTPPPRSPILSSPFVKKETPPQDFRMGKKRDPTKNSRPKKVKSIHGVDGEVCGNRKITSFFK
jgi:putative SOS response-associated peptidase YedK